MSIYNIICTGDGVDLATLHTLSLTANANAVALNLWLYVTPSMPSETTDMYMRAVKVLKDKVAAINAEHRAVMDRIIALHIERRSIALTAKRYDAIMLEINKLQNEASLLKTGGLNAPINENPVIFTTDNQLASFIANSNYQAEVDGLYYKSFYVVPSTAGEDLPVSMALIDASHGFDYGATAPFIDVPNEIVISTFITELETDLFKSLNNLNGGGRPTGLLADEFFPKPKATGGKRK